MFLDELVKTTKDEDDKKYREIISRIPRSLKESGGSCLILAGRTEFNGPAYLAYRTGLYGFFYQQTISPKILPPIAKRVYDYCLSQGFKVTIRYQSPRGFKVSAEENRGGCNMYIER